MPTIIKAFHIVASKIFPTNADFIVLLSSFQIFILYTNKINTAVVDNMTIPILEYKPKTSKHPFMFKKAHIRT